MLEKRLLQMFWKTIPAKVKDEKVRDLLVDKSSMAKLIHGGEGMTEREIVLESTHKGETHVNARIMPGCVHKIGGERGWLEFWVLKTMGYAVAAGLKECGKQYKKLCAELKEGKHDEVLSVALGIKVMKGLDYAVMTAAEFPHASKSYVQLQGHVQKCVQFMRAWDDKVFGLDDLEKGTPGKKKRKGGGGGGGGGSSAAGGGGGNLPVGDGMIQQVPFAWRFFEGDSSEGDSWAKVTAEIGARYSQTSDTPRVVIATSPPWGMNFGKHDIALNQTEVQN